MKYVKRASGQFERISWRLLSNAARRTCSESTAEMTFDKLETEMSHQEKLEGGKDLCSCRVIKLLNANIKANKQKNVPK